MWEAQRTIELLPISGVTSRQWEGSYSPLHGDRLAVASGIRSSYKVPSSPFPPSISLHHTPFISYLSPVFIIAQIRYLIPLKSVTMAPRVAIVFVCDPRRSTRGPLWINKLTQPPRRQYSMHGHILKLARAEQKGIESAGGKVDLFQ